MPDELALHEICVVDHTSGACATPTSLVSTGHLHRVQVFAEWDVLRKEFRMDSIEAFY
jgi:hypothetical protein